MLPGLQDSISDTRAVTRASRLESTTMGAESKLVWSAKNKTIEWRTTYEGIKHLGDLGSW